MKNNNDEEMDVHVLFVFSGGVRSFSTLGAKGSERVEGRLDGLVPTNEEIEEQLKSHYDEEGSYRPPHASSFPSMSRRDCMMNVRIPPLGIAPPPFTDEHIREIEEKTTLKKENLEWAKSHWMDESLKPDEKENVKMFHDIQEMYLKGVQFATINLYLDWFSGASEGYKHGICNKSWARLGG